MFLAAGRPRAAPWMPRGRRATCKRGPRGGPRPAPASPAPAEKQVALLRELLEPVPSRRSLAAAALAKPFLAAPPAEPAALPVLLHSGPARAVRADPTTDLAPAARPNAARNPAVPGTVSLGLGWDGEGGRLESARRAPRGSGNPARPEVGARPRRQTHLGGRQGPLCHGEGRHGPGVAAVAPWRPVLRRPPRVVPGARLPRPHTGGRLEDGLGGPAGGHRSAKRERHGR
jgi:translation initiation factor IF-2